MLEPGDAAPEITLADHRGETVTVDPAAAGHTVVYFYPRADTPGCTAEACGFRDEWDAFEDADVAVVGISDDPVSRLRTTPSRSSRTSARSTTEPAASAPEARRLTRGTEFRRPRPRSPGASAGRTRRR